MRSATVWALTVLFCLCYIIPSHLRAVAERAYASHANRNTALDLTANAATLKNKHFCDLVSLKQQNISSRMSQVNIVAGSFSKSNIQITPPQLRKLASAIRPSSEAPDPSKLLQLINAYRSSHSALTLEAIQDKNLCKRKFVVGTYSCPMQVGERMHEFLNAYAGAVITNRTLLWRYCQRKGCQNQPSDTPLPNDQTACDNLIERMPWVPAYSDVLIRLERGGCPVDVQKLASTVVPLAKHATLSESLLACCHIDTIPGECGLYSRITPIP